MQHERKVDIKQESGLSKKWEGNQFLEQETLTLQWDMSTIQVDINMERNISNTEGSFFLYNFPYSDIVYYKGVIHRGNCVKN